MFIKSGASIEIYRDNHTLHIYKQHILATNTVATVIPTVVASLKNIGLAIILDINSLVIPVVASVYDSVYVKRFLYRKDVHNRNHRSRCTNSIHLQL